jgi:hypothetical protein
LLVEREVVRVLRTRFSGSATPWAERTHRVAYQDLQAAQGEIVNDIAGAFAANAIADDPSIYQTYALTPGPEDEDGDGEETGDGFSTPMDAFFSEMQLKFESWLLEMIRTHDGRGSWEAHRKVLINSRAHDFLDRGKRKAKGSAGRQDHVVAGMVDHPDEHLSDTPEFDWISDRDFEDVFLAAEDQIGKLKGEAREIAVALLTDPRRTYTDIGRDFRLDGRQISRQMKRIFRTCPALEEAATLTKLVGRYLMAPSKNEKQKFNQKLEKKIDSICTNNRGGSKHQNLGIGQGWLIITQLTAEAKPVVEHWAGGHVLLDRFEPQGAWTGNNLSFAPEQSPPAGPSTLSPSKWYRDEPHSVPHPMQVRELQVIEPSVPLHRRHARALQHVEVVETVARLRPPLGWRENDYSPYPSCYLRHLASLCRARWNHDIDALAVEPWSLAGCSNVQPALGWRANEPQNYGDRASHRINLNDGSDGKVELKLKGNNGTKKYDRQQGGVVRAVDPQELSEWSPLPSKKPARKPIPAKTYKQWAEQDCQVKLGGTVKITRLLWSDAEQKFVEPPFRGEAFACPTAKRTRIREEIPPRRYLRRRSPPVSGNLIGWFDYLLPRFSWVCLPRRQSTRFLCEELVSGPPDEQTLEIEAFEGQERRRKA